MTLLMSVIICVITLILLIALLLIIRKNNSVPPQLVATLKNLEDKISANERILTATIETITSGQQAKDKEIRDNTIHHIKALGLLQTNLTQSMGDTQRKSLDSFSSQLADSNRLSEEKLERMRTSIEKKLADIETSNEKELDRMRATVDEKLHHTLETRLKEAFSNVSERLEHVDRGLGEIKTLTTDVGDLKKVLSNVKVRGTWGEHQLKAILNQTLIRTQYEENIATIPNSTERVEFAIKLPGADNRVKQIWLPIDAKFPLSDYQSLIKASENGNEDGVIMARKQLKTHILNEAQKIRNKYVSPPYTTDFGIMYLPIEGLYVEVLDIDGLYDEMIRKYKIVPAGPTTVTALLNSLQVGFRTLAIDKHASEVWSLLAEVRNEIRKFEITVKDSKNRIHSAYKKIEDVEQRIRVLNRTLQKVEDASKEIEELNQ